MSLRPATLEDAVVLSLIHRLAAFVTPRQTAEESLPFVREQLMRENQTWVADTGGAVVGYIAFNDDWVSQLFVHPGHQGQGHGAALLAHAMATGANGSSGPSRRTIRRGGSTRPAAGCWPNSPTGRGTKRGSRRVRYVGRR